MKVDTGFYIFACGLVVFGFNFLRAFMRKEMAGDIPCGVGAGTLEWTLNSPPPFHPFEKLPRSESGAPAIAPPSEN